MSDINYPTDEKEIDIPDTCQSCEGTGEVNIPGKEDEVDMVPCPDCRPEEYEDFTGPTEGDR